MPSTKEYLDFVLEQLSELESVSYRAMMGEYVLYCGGKVIGGVYDDRFLLKAAPAVLRILDEEGRTPQFDVPYPGAKEQLVADIDDRALCCRLVRAAADVLPAPKRKKG